MQTLFNFIPYLAAPFLFPGISASSRLTTFILLSVIAGMHLYREFIDRHEEEKAILPSFILGLTMLGTGIYAFSIQDSWSFHLHWTTMASSLLLIYTLSHSQIPAWKGWLITIAITWGLLLFHPFLLFMLPFNWFSQTITEIYPWIYHFSEFSAINLKAIIPPESHIISLLYHNVIIWTTVILMALGYGHSNRWIRVTVSILIPLWFFFLIFISGNAVLLLLGSTFFFFSLFFHWPPSLRRLILTLSFLALCLAFYIFNLIPLHIHAQILFPSLNYLDVNFAFFPWINHPHEGLISWGFLSSSLNPIALSFVILPLFILIVFSWRQRHDHDPALPAALSVTFLLALAHWQKPFALFSNPFFWIAYGPFLSNHTIPLSHPSFHETLSVFRRYLPPTTAIILVLLWLPTFLNHFHDWKAEFYLQRFTKTNRVQERLSQAEAAYRSAPYRGDTSALFATALLDLLIQNKAIPTEKTEQQLLHALQTSSYYGYAPIMAYKRLSDLYFIHARSSRSIDILEQATHYFPKIPVLHEMLAERLVVLGQRRKAVDVYQHCVNLDPTEPRIRQKLIVLYQNLGMKNEENSERKKLTILNPFWEPNRNTP